MSGSMVEVEGNVVRISGEVDMANALQVRQAIEDAAQAGLAIVVDLTHTTFIDSSGLSELVRPLHDGHLVSIRGANPLVRRMLDLTGIDVVLKVVDDGPIG